MKCVSRCRWACLALFVLLGGCGKKDTPVDPNNNNGNNNNGSSPQVLRETISIDLAQVASMAAVTGGTPTALWPESMAVGAAVGPDQGGGGPALYALTLSGEIVPVSMVEQPGEASGGHLPEPPVQGIYPTKTWIVFSTQSFRVIVPPATDPSQAVDCNSIWARRSDGALYCSNMPINGNPNPDDRYDGVHPDASGNLVYVIIGGATDPVIYEVTLSESGPPIAAPAVPGHVFPIWFLTNGAGDLFLLYYQSAIDQTTPLAQILPADGSNATVLAHGYNTVIHGAFGGPDENTFYASGGGTANANEQIVTLITRDGASFIETPTIYSCVDANTYNGLFRMGSDIYSFSGMAKALLRVVESGVVVTQPTPIPLAGIDHVVNSNGAAIQSAGDQVVFLASTGTAYEFVRHDGTTQQDIPIDPSLDLQRVTVADDGAIDFLAIRTGTNEKVRGVIAAGSTEVTLAAAGVLDPAQVIVFTRID